MGLTGVLIYDPCLFALPEILPVAHMRSRHCFFTSAVCARPRGEKGTYHSCIRNFCTVK